MSSENGPLNTIKVNPVPVFDAVGYSRLEFQKNDIGQEVQILKSHKKTYAGMRSVSSISITDQGGLWFGHGFYNELRLNENLNIGLSFLPGIYARGKEVDLGGWLMFRAGVEFIIPVSLGSSISFSYDHRSSGDIWSYNPGLETWQIRFRTLL